MRIDEVKVYMLSMEIGEDIWGCIVKWDYFYKSTVGRQLIRAVDSIAANISEGYGRFHYKENKKFLYYARGSLIETQTWLTKARNRNLLDRHTFEALLEKSENLRVKLNLYLKSIGEKSK